MEPVDGEAAMTSYAMTYYTVAESPLGRILMTANARALTGLYFQGQRYAPERGQEWEARDDLPAFARTREWLAAYFSGQPPCIDVPLAPNGTNFQCAVWQQIAGIPGGETITYAELARRAGYPAAVRAAGAATGRNPISLLIPCHRVVGSDGSLTGYAGGLERKRRLLALEAGTSGGGAPPTMQGSLVFPASGVFTPT
jgi:methylated-DNA-[protein]-cysteine S-methyltransferase